MNKGILLLVAIIFGLSGVVLADERYFTYSYEASTLSEGDLEFEQHITSQSGKDSGDYSAWNFRTEIEYGITSNYTTALYLNWDSIRSEGGSDDEEVNDTKFKGVSWENIVQISNPRLDPMGMAFYTEGTTDGLSHELEFKLLFSKTIGSLELVSNVAYEMEWEREDARTEREAELEFTFGASYHVTPKLVLGVEARNKSAYPEGFNLDGQEYQTWSVGPNIHYGTPKWWTTLTVLPQIWGNGDGSKGNRQLTHEEELEVRLVFGVPL